jgi:23S rRNA (uracil1939-C5)-methyltransferase
MKTKKENREIVELDVESIGFEGIAVARLNDKVHFVKGAVPGDRILAAVKRARRRYAEVQLIEVLKESADRVPPKCHHFGVCGGCSWQNLKYEEQIKWKRQHVIDAFERIGKVHVDEYLETMPAPLIFNYRNKMEFTVGASRWLSLDEINSENENISKSFAIGLHVPQRYDKVLDVTECHIQQPMGNILLNSVRAKALELDVSAFNLQDQTGFLRNVIVRYSQKNEEFIIVFVTNKLINDCEQLFIDWCKTELPRILVKKVNILHAINSTRSPVTIESFEVLHGTDFLIENILGLDFKLSPFSFFQTNSSQLDNFVSLILEFAELKQNDVVWDLYCGVGTITLPAAKKSDKVFGIELVESSIADAKNNAKLNSIDNIAFFCSDLHTKETPELLNKLEKPDVIIIDPPRSGMHQNLVQHLLKIEAPRIVYVSCNPTTQARDCELLSEKYKVLKVQAVDMFPHTYHVESVALLVKKND